MYSSVRTLPPPPNPCLFAVPACTSYRRNSRSTCSDYTSDSRTGVTNHPHSRRGLNFVQYGPRACETMIDALIVLLRGYTSTYTKEPRLLTKCGFS